MLSSPAIDADGTIYVGSWDTNLYAVNADGSLKWRLKTGKTHFLLPSHRFRWDHIRRLLRQQTLRHRRGASAYAYAYTDGLAYANGNP